MLTFFQKLTTRRTEDGASAVEYGLLVAAIAAVIIIAVFGIGKVVGGAFKDTCDTMAGHATSAGSGASCS